MWEEGCGFFPPFFFFAPAIGLPPPTILARIGGANILSMEGLALRIRNDCELCSLFCLFPRQHITTSCLHIWDLVCTYMHIRFEEETTFKHRLPSLIYTNRFFFLPSRSAPALPPSRIHAPVSIFREIYWLLCLANARVLGANKASSCPKKATFF